MLINDFGRIFLFLTLDMEVFPQPNNRGSKTLHVPQTETMMLNH